MAPHFNFRTKKGPTVSDSNIRDIAFYGGVQKLYGIDISRFLPCILQILDNLRRLFIFSNYSIQIGPSKKFRYLTLDIMKSFLLWTIRRKTTMNESLNFRLKAESWTCWKSPLKQEKYPYNWSTIEVKRINSSVLCSYSAHFNRISKFDQIFIVPFLTIFSG